MTSCTNCGAPSCEQRCPYDFKVRTLCEHDLTSQ